MNNLTHNSVNGGTSFKGIIDSKLNYNTITLKLMSMKKMQTISNNHYSHYSYIQVNTYRILIRGALENVFYYNPEHFH